jgi:putative nucleotidyltransferase with HDIG domain
MDRLRFHGSRWALLLGVAILTRLVFPVPAELASAGPLAAVAGPILYNAMLLSVFWLLLFFYRRETYRQWREMTFLAALFALVIVSAAILRRMFPDRPELMPIPFAAIVVTVLYNGRLSVFAAATLAILLGGQWGLRENQILFFGLVGGMAAALSARKVRRRSEAYVTIGAVAAADALASIALGLTLGWPLDRLLGSMAAGAVIALASASVVMVFLPVAEWWTRITTDFTLLELSDPSRPLLRRLALEAPGTYAHSVAMANVCEAACNAIGANGLLARVGCYYHDIGKLTQPLYFVENQLHGSNPHDKLRPEESARIIRDHVAAGLVLAEEAKLPAVVRAFIPEHHGTSRLEYFIERARGRQLRIDPDSQDFRYPGPRPRSAETAVSMLADSAEAALRALDDPTPEQVRDAIERLVEHKVATGQLRDAPLTLRDLDRITGEFIRIMTGMYHSRIDYPDQPGGISASQQHA